MYKKLIRKTSLCFFTSTLFISSAFANREINYGGQEEEIFVKPGDPTQIIFESGEIAGGFKRKNSYLSIDKKGNKLVIFSKSGLSPEGESMIIHSKNEKYTYSLRIKPASDEQKNRDSLVTVHDEREFENDEPFDPTDQTKKVPAAYSSVVGLMREMVKVAEFGKQKGIPGYKRSNRYSGEVVLNDGSIDAKINEVFMGTDLWGYVVKVSNLLDSSQRLNPATFRIDGTRAVVAKNWEIAPKAATAEQKINGKDNTYVYIVTRAKRR